MKLLPARKADTSGPATPEIDTDEVYDFSESVKPALNLIPTVVREARGFAQTLRMSIVGLIAVTAIVVIGYVAVLGGALTANSEADNAALSATSTQVKIKSLDDVQAYYDAVTERKSEVKAKFSGSIDYSSIYGAVNAALPAGVSITSFATAIGTTCAGADPFQPTAAIGCATIDATAPDTNTISALTSALGRDSTKVLVDPYASNISDSGSGSGLSFKLTVNFTQAAYGDRFADYGTTTTTTTPTATTAPSSTTTDSSGSNDAAAGK
ncbi:hypothetical protein GCM10025867_47330 (plasmid) [Frondihabitans sucicola]|uniref:Fimbrial assembly protein n=1 Tax=Frondihabitans sucicola TaxID=1268041 RepID=A0ABM8GVQ1_9MICO|nr:hypothetical protein [Frondihabitans sucicola]BDZ52492.1 hypothetical protein GCM10025867_47330 [Frondihabitans sucicola]